MIPWRFMAVEAEADSVALELVRIVAAVADDRRMDHAGAEDGDPAGSLADRAADAAHLALMSNATLGSVNG